VGLRNQSKTNSSLIVFGILSNVTDPKNIKEVYEKVLLRTCASDTYICRTKQ
jgi:hypothetical protein